MASNSKPVVIDHDGIAVVRDDLFAGGTKARFLGALFDDADEVVYASPAEGGAQTALATVAARLGKRATIFVAKRAAPHPRSIMAKALGATIYQVTPGYLSVAQARARRYCADKGAKLAPFGVDMPLAIDAISAAAAALEIEPAEVWCAAGSGVLARGLARAWPGARRHVVQIGRKLDAGDVDGATIHVHPLAFGQQCRLTPPFPADPHYDAKAWEIAQAKHGAGLVVFWNVIGPAVTNGA
jgi:hypothetical protein